MTKSAAELIDALGGQTAVANQLSVASNAVGNWRKRGFPAWAVPAVRRLCKQHGVDPSHVADPMPRRRVATETEVA